MRYKKQRVSKSILAFVMALMLALSPIGGIRWTPERAYAAGGLYAYYDADNIQVYDSRDNANGKTNEISESNIQSNKEYYVRIDVKSELQSKFNQAYNVVSATGSDIQNQNYMFDALSLEQDVSLTITISNAKDDTIVVKKGTDTLTEKKLAAGTSIDDTVVTIEFDAPAMYSYTEVGATEEDTSMTGYKHWKYTTTDSALIVNPAISLTPIIIEVDAPTVDLITSEGADSWYTRTGDSNFATIQFAALDTVLQTEGYQLQYTIADTSTQPDNPVWTTVASNSIAVDNFNVDSYDTKYLFLRYYKDEAPVNLISAAIPIAIDNEQPVLGTEKTVDTDRITVDGSNTKYWIKNQVNLNIALTDAGSGIASVQYGFASSNTSPESLIDASYDSDNQRITIPYSSSDKNLYLYIKATDKVGNADEEYYNLSDIYFDQTNPRMITDVKYYSTYSQSDPSVNQEITSSALADWQGNSIYVVVKAEDEDAPANETKSDIACVILNDGGLELQRQSASDSEGNYVFLVGHGIHNLSLQACDHAGNLSDATDNVLIRIDQSGITDPKVVLQPQKTAFRTTFRIDASAESLCGITKVTYVYQENDTNIPGSEQVYTVSDISEADTVYLVQAEIPDALLNQLNQKKNLKIKATFEDACGRVVTVYSVPFAINKDGSEIIFENTDGAWKKQDITVPVRIQDVAGIESVTFQVNDNLVTAERTVVSDTEENYLLILTENSPSTGSKVTVSVTNKAGETSVSEWLYRLDKDAPVIALSDIENNRKYGENQTLEIDISENIWSSATVTAVAYRTLDGVKQSVNLGDFVLSLDNSRFSKEFTEDGLYDIQIRVVDAAGNSDQKSIRFLIDKTAPIVSFQNRNGNWTNQNVTVPIRVTEGLSGIQNVVVTENGTIVTPTVVNDSASEKNYVITLTNDSPASGTRVAVTATNEAGVTVTSEYTYRLDKTAPSLVLSGVANGNVYNLNQTVSVRAEDNNWADMQPVTITATRLLDGVTTDQDLGSFSLNTRSTVNTRSFSEDGVYLVTATAVDAAGNQTIQTIGFTLDKTAPVLSITGAPDGAYSGNPVTLNFQAIESFYETDNVTITVERQYEGSAYGSRVNFVNSGKNSNVSNTFATDGDYTVIMTATDGAGNVATEQTIHFTVDVTAPVVSIMGTKDYLVTKDQVSVEFSVTESYFETNQVRITGNRRGADGTVENLNIEGWTNTAKVSTLSKEFTEDGYYTLTITSTDRAGNSRQETIHFTIDTQPPVIADLSRYNGKYLKGFVLEETLEDMISELTSPTVRMTLNGSAYDGSEITEDGKYTLIIEVTDEVGLAATRTIEFIIDNTPPKVIFAGAKDGEWYTEPIRLNITLENENDTIDGITINGEQQDMQGKTFYEYSFNSFDDYEVVVYTSDAAGNTNSQTISFTYAEHAKTSYLWIFITASVLACGLIGGLVIAGVKKKKN